VFHKVPSKRFTKTDFPFTYLKRIIDDDDGFL
jgi:hypothetical protein